MTKNAYIHIPFCKSKCNYCSFISFPNLELKEQYIESLIIQIKQEYRGEKLNTLYFGGGTPSVLNINDFDKIIRLFNFEDNAEITTEINPDGIQEEYLQELKKLGVNRISIGSQTFDDKILKLIGRRHNSEQIKAVVRLARMSEFTNISLDLIYGLPTQSLASFEYDLLSVADLGVEHVSLYGLKVEEGCAFYTNLPDALPDLDLQADMYLKAIEVLKNKGFEHYEISNFSLPDYNSRHNLNYWENKTYYGFGCSASGYLSNSRYTNEVNLDKYIKNPCSKISKENLTQQEMLEEEIFLGLRKLSGINIEDINQKFEINFDKKYVKILGKYLDTGHIVKTQIGYALSVEGILASNGILAEFID